ncbi:MAG: hypothetical protein LCH84_16385 [Gemmatimonadetes bacterium]|nr:hypothetical protein [Gemmatimonadota bacterium]
MSRDVGGAPVRRAGATLVELLVALPLALLVAALAALLLLRAAREGRRDDARRVTRRELRHAALALGADVAPLSGARLRQWSDSLIEFSAPLVSVVLCDVLDSTVFVAAAPGDGAPVVLASARDGDDLVAWRDTSASAALAPAAFAPGTITPVPVVLTVRAPGASAGVGRCPLGGGTAPRWRVPIHGAAPAALVGMPATLHRDTQWLHYRSGTAWWLGKRARDRGGWETVQPVAGPLLSAAAGGMRIQALDASAQPTAHADSVTLLQVTWRMPRRALSRTGSGRDSAVLWLPLRAGGAP